MKSSRVTLTVVAAMGLAARAQQGANPCAPFSFNEKACKASIQQGGFCSGGAWVPATYHQQYPYYYDVYSTYVSAGGAVTPARMENCSRHAGGAHGVASGAVARGGFGAARRGGHE